MQRLRCYVFCVDLTVEERLKSEENVGAVTSDTPDCDVVCRFSKLFSLFLACFYPLFPHLPLLVHLFFFLLKEKQFHCHWFTHSNSLHPFFFPPIYCRPFFSHVYLSSTQKMEAAYFPKMLNLTMK